MANRSEAYRFRDGKTALSGLPRHLPIEPVRGQLLATPWPEGVPPVVLYHGHKYLLQRGAEAIMGSTMERSGFDAHTTVEGLAEIRRTTEQLCPAIGRASTIASSVVGHCTTATPRLRVAAAKGS